MHLLERPAALAELDELFRQWRAGLLSTSEYKIAFGLVDSAHSHDLRCTNGDGRIAVLNIDGTLLCGVCGRKWQEANDSPRLADERPGYLLSLPRQVTP